MTTVKNPQVGQISPSQLLYTYGIGAIVDLPQLSAIVTGLEDWPADPSVAREITEARLLRAVRVALGSQVTALRFPPATEETSSLMNPFEEEARIGVPVATFPRWMVCPACRLLAPLKSDLFALKPNLFHPDRTCYEHVNCDKSKKRPAVLPARFLVACERGHLDDFPWIEFVHHGPSTCNGTLRLLEYGPSGEARDLEVKCDDCGNRRRLSEAFGRENRAKNMPQCRARRPHLRDYDPDGCAEKMRAVALGASNSWFPLILSTVAIPEATAKLDLLVEENWATVKYATSLEVLAAFRMAGQLGAFAQYQEREIWDAILRKRVSENDTDTSNEQSDLKTPEWVILSNPDPSRNSTDFRLRVVKAPTRYQNQIPQVVLVERLREVQAMVGFTRIDSPGELAEPGMEEITQIAPISRQKPTWVPAVEVRGEGLFIRFDEARIQSWLGKPAMKERDLAFLDAHTRWRKARGFESPEENYPGLRYVLLHSFSHSLMRQFALECGYTAASIRERIYCRNAEEPGGPMAGILIYTAAPDSEGTLGGLVSLGEPQILERHINAALESAGLCASDPTCAEHQPSQTGLSVHAAACHACMFAPETSCERGNKYLDRSVLVLTVKREDLAFFD